MGLMETVIDIPAEHEANVFGQFDAYAKKIERTLHVTLIARGESVKIMGDALKVEKAKKVLDQLIELSKRGNTIQEQNVDYTLALVMEDSEENVLEIDKDIICHTLQGKPIKPKTLGQKKYVDAIRKQMIVFGLGPAGTGKTYLAMAMAITAFKNNEVGRIILTRPAIEAGEKLGQALADVEIQKFTTPYVTNVTAQYVTGPEQVKELLVSQVSSSVRWQQCVEQMIDDGVDTFIEIGPGKTLTGFLKKINRNVKALHVEKTEDLDEVRKECL